MTTILSKPDFKDWLSPMLVKELRQGMRSRVFMAAFFLTQVLMILSTILNLTSSSGNGEFGVMSEFLNGVFWFMIAVPVLLLTPIRGFGSLHGEMKERTLELVFLTRLTASRITVGKWMALMVQALLLLCGVLPYVLVRYFLGGVNILADLQSLLFILVVSGMLTALTVALSPYESKLLRGLLVIGLFIGFFILLANFVTLISVGMTLGTTASVVAFFYGGLALFVPAVIILSLEIGASRIAPSAENHAILKRLIGIYFVVAGAILICLHAGASTVITYVLALLTIVAIDALAETQEFNRTVYRPFLKLGAIGRFLALFLTPGWVSASWYILLLTVVCGAGLALAGDAGNELTRVSFLGSLIFPAALIRLFVPRTQHFLGFYIAIQFFCGALFILFAMAGIGGDLSTPIGIWPIPSCVFLFSINERIQPEQLHYFMTATSAITILSMGVLIGRTIAPLRDIRAALRQDAKSDV
ncbi:hypothetical protein BH09VER1_BH09VER1_00610 [soil metagenome]